MTRIGLAMVCLTSRSSGGAFRLALCLELLFLVCVSRVLEKRFLESLEIRHRPARVSESDASWRGWPQPSEIALGWCRVRGVSNYPQLRDVDALVEAYLEEIDSECEHYLGMAKLDDAAKAGSLRCACPASLFRVRFGARSPWFGFSSSVVPRFSGLAPTTSRAASAPRSGALDASLTGSVRSVSEVCVSLSAEALLEASSGGRRWRLNSTGAELSTSRTVLRFRPLARFW